MNRNLERRIERAEQVVGVSESDDPRVYSYPNDLSELMVMAQMTPQQRKEYFRKRTKRPSPEMCDRWDELFKKLKATKNNQTAQSRAAI